MGTSRRLIFCLLFCLAACGTAVPLTSPSTPPSTLLPTPTLKVSPVPTPIETVAPLPDSGWELLQAGLERRTIRLLDESGQQIEQLTILRIDPILFEFRIAYSPGQPKTLAAWQAETGALVVLNGGFFTADFLATGLIVVDGQPSGSSYAGFGGMVTMSPDGVEVRSLVERPYDPHENIAFALQAFPMLVLNGAAAYQTVDQDAARRTVIGQDANGRILLILATQGGLTLAELSSTLAASDFGLVHALNLDGGTSTGLILAKPPESIPAFVPLPSVITISPK